MTQEKCTVPCDCATCRLLVAPSMMGGFYSREANRIRKELHKKTVLRQRARWEALHLRQRARWEALYKMGK